MSAAMIAAGVYLKALTGLEKLVCGLGFAVMAGALALDVGARLWARLVHTLTQNGVMAPALGDALSSGGGVLGAPQIAVLGMIAVASFGAGIAAQQGAELRARFLEGVLPKTLAPAADRLGDGLTALILATIGALCAGMAAQSLQFGDVAAVLGWPIWPAQGVIAAAFLANAGRYLAFALFPNLRPALGASPETPGQEAAP